MLSQCSASNASQDLSSLLIALDVLSLFRNSTVDVLQFEYPLVNNQCLYIMGIHTILSDENCGISVTVRAVSCNVQLLHGFQWPI